MTASRRAGQALQCGWRQTRPEVRTTGRESRSCLEVPRQTPLRTGTLHEVGRAGTRVNMEDAAWLPGRPMHSTTPGGHVRQEGSTWLIRRGKQPQRLGPARGVGRMPEGRASGNPQRQRLDTRPLSLLSNTSDFRVGLDTVYYVCILDGMRRWPGARDSRLASTSGFRGPARVCRRRCCVAVYFFCAGKVLR